MDDGASSSLDVRGQWTYAARRELRKRGFRWMPRCRAWRAPNAEARDLAISQLSGWQSREWSLTVHGDAGWKDGVGRWAWYARYEGGVVKGVSQGEMHSVFNAEAASLLWGLRAALAAHPPDKQAPRRIVYFRNDNLGVIQHIKQKRRSNWLVKQILELCKTHCLTVNAKHVKGHQNPGNSTAAWVNYQVDAMSSLRGVTV